jgi:hypothetical protein
LWFFESPYKNPGESEKVFSNGVHVFHKYVLWGFAYLISLNVNLLPVQIQ